MRLQPLAAFLAALCPIGAGPILAQRPVAGPQGAVVRVHPAEATLQVGEKLQLSAEIVDPGGRPVAGKVFFFSRARRALRVSREGEMQALQPGEHRVIARAMIDDKRGPEASVVVTVPHPTPTAVEIRDLPSVLYVGTSARIRGAVLDDRGGERSDLEVSIQSSTPSIASLDALGILRGHAAGEVELIAEGGGLQARSAVRVVANPVASIKIEVGTDRARTGDVLHVRSLLADAAGRKVEGVPVTLSVRAEPDDQLGHAASAQIRQDGRFVAETPGLYTIVASCGSGAVTETTLRCEPRFPTKQKLVKVGHGEVLDVHTSDLWVWEGLDGRDYAVTGTWGANGDTIFWDVTDPSKIERIASITVDARTVNDVKVSADGRVCVISREGASNRKNGIVILNVEDPHQPEIVSTFDDELTGGVHNVFIDGGFVYALSAARRYDVIDLNNASAPNRVGSFQLFEPGASIHDVWIDDGIAFSSNWRYGLRLVDVGKGIAGGSPSNPVEFAHYAYPNGANHAAFPFRSPDTGRFYVVAGDEAFPFGLNVKNHPTYPRGWIHFVDFTDHENPAEVARYQVPEAGTHNLWIDGTTMYVAYYNAGLRVVDISGELMGDLYRQGREIAWFLPTHPEGVVPNAPMTWGPQPHKGHIFISDWNSGLWAVKLVEEKGRSAAWR